MTSGSEGQRDQVRLLPGCSRLGPEHRLAAPVPQRRVLVEQQRKCGKELVEVHISGRFATAWPTSLTQNLAIVSW